jgi:hypothetical protein
MTDPRKQAFSEYLRDLADRMDLRDWHVEIIDRAPANGRHSSVWLCYGQRRAQIMLSEEFLASDVEEQRATLVHELLHLHFAPMDELVEGWLSPDQYKGHLLLFEYGIDGSARAWARTLPLMLRQPVASA